MTLSGSEFRDRIAELLRIKHDRVETEVRVGATTADVWYIDESHPTFPQTIAIEAKDWSRPLTSSQIGDIYSKYVVALTSGEIDRLWIISNFPLSGSPNETVRRSKGLAHSTFSQFEASLINFSPLIRHNIDLFDTDPVRKNFIDSKTLDGLDLLSEVRNWISGKKSGLVVQGGYGIGKTTFSKYICARLSEEYRSGSFDRVPIRFSLGDLFYKQDLSSLISSSLAGAENGVQIKNFTLSMFLEMNRLGRLLLVFDGFDEMRHAIDLEDFLFNFEQMRMLMGEKSKVILLGRPDAFLSSSDETKALSALFESPRSVSHSLDKLHVGFFDREDVDNYLTKFIANRGLDERKRSKIVQLAATVSRDGKDNILTRPVQLSMFTQIVDDFLDEDDKSLTRYSLYEHFIYKFIAREQRKPARKISHPSNFPIGQDPRAKFMQDVAWWLVTSKRENKFTLTELAGALSSLEMTAGGQSELALKDRILGSVIEPLGSTGVLGNKAKRYYYFPHKSYVEFLVAQYFSYTTFNAQMHRRFVEHLSPEIVSFLVEGPVGGIENLRRGLDYAKGTVPRYIVETASLDPEIPLEIERSTNPSAIDTYIYYFYSRSMQNSDAFLKRQIGRANTAARVLSLVNCVGDALKARGDRDLAKVLLLNFMSSVFDMHRLHDYAESGEPVIVFRDDDLSVKAAALIAAVELSSSGVHLYPDRLMDFALSSFGATTTVELWAQGDHREMVFTSEEMDFPPGLPVAATLMRNVSGADRISVPVQLRGSAETLYGNSRSDRLR